MHSHLKSGRSQHVVVVFGVGVGIVEVGNHEHLQFMDTKEQR